MLIKNHWQSSSESDSATGGILRTRDVRWDFNPRAQCSPVAYVLLYRSSVAPRQAMLESSRPWCRCCRRPTDWAAVASRILPTKSIPRFSPAGQVRVCKRVRIYKRAVRLLSDAPCVPSQYLCCWYEPHTASVSLCKGSALASSQEVIRGSGCHHRRLPSVSLSSSFLPSSASSLSSTLAGAVS